MEGAARRRKGAEQLPPNPKPLFPAPSVTKPQGSGRRQAAGGAPAKPHRPPAPHCQERGAAARLRAVPPAAVAAAAAAAAAPGGLAERPELESWQLSDLELPGLPHVHELDALRAGVVREQLLQLLHRHLAEGAPRRAVAAAGRRSRCWMEGVGARGWAGRLHQRGRWHDGGRTISMRARRATGRGGAAQHLRAAAASLVPARRWGCAQRAAGACRNGTAWRWRARGWSLRNSDHGRGCDTEFGVW
jgi:hypothetical protein